METPQQDLPSVGLRIEEPKSQFHVSEPLDLRITLENKASEPYYVCGSISLTVSEPVCEFDLQFRSLESEDFTNRRSKISIDTVFPIFGPKETVEEFKAKHNLILLKHNEFVGMLVSYSWTDFALLPPGKYDLRVVHDSFGSIPDLGHPFFSRKLVSNTLRLEIIE